MTQVPPPLLPCCRLRPQYGLDENSYREAFAWLYIETPWYLEWPKGRAQRVEFEDKDFDHIFFKEENPERKGPRIIWQSPRAERLFWIGFTIDNFVEIRQMGISDLMVFVRVQDPQWAWFLLVCYEFDHSVLRVSTAYPLTKTEYSSKCDKSKRLIWCPENGRRAPV